MAVYKGKPEQRQRTVRTMIGVLVLVLLLTAGQAIAQISTDGSQFWHQGSHGIVGGGPKGATSLVPYTRGRDVNCAKTI